MRLVANTWWGQSVALVLAMALVAPQALAQPLAAVSQGAAANSLWGFMDASGTLRVPFAYRVHPDVGVPRFEQGLAHDLWDDDARTMFFYSVEKRLRILPKGLRIEEVVDVVDGGVAVVIFRDYSPPNGTDAPPMQRGYGLWVDDQSLVASSNERLLHEYTRTAPEGVEVEAHKTLGLALFESTDGHGYLRLFADKSFRVEDVSFANARAFRSNRNSTAIPGSFFAAVAKLPPEALRAPETRADYWNKLRWGLIDEAMNFVIKPDDHDYEKATPFVCDLARVVDRKTGKHRYLRLKSGSPRIEPAFNGREFDDARDFSPGGFAVVKDDNQVWHVLSDNGELVAFEESSDIQKAWGFREGLALVRYTDEWAYVDTLGEVKFRKPRTQYQDADGFHGGLARMFHRRGSRPTYFDRNGMRVTPKLDPGR